MSMEHDQPDEIDSEPDAAHDQHEVGVMDVFVVEEALQRLYEDGEAKRHQEDSVHQRSQHFGPSPAERILLSVPF